MRIQGLIAAIAVAAVSAVPAAASPVLAVEVHVRPADRPLLKRAIEGAQAAKLAAWRASGFLTGYRLLISRFPDAGEWDAFELLHFKDETTLARWRMAASEPFVPEVLTLAQSIETTPSELVRAEGVKSEHPAVLVIPYESLVSPNEYLSYLDGYTIPQFRGWMKAGVLDGFDILSSLYPAGRPWTSLITLRYRNDGALARRDEVVQKTRAALASDHTWKSFAESKKNIRTEHLLSVADQVAVAGDIE